MGAQPSPTRIRPARVMAEEPGRKKNRMPTPMTQLPRRIIWGSRSRMVKKPLKARPRVMPMKNMLA